MALGPVQHLLIAFPGNRFDGSIAPELTSLVEQGLVRILDLVFIKKDEDGTVTAFEYDELDEFVAFAEIDGEAGSLLHADDVDEAAALLEPGSSAAFLLWEDCWAAPLADAVRRSGGVIVGGGRVPAEVVEEVLDLLAETS